MAEIRTWQYGSVYNDSFYAAAMGSDGSILLASETEGPAGDSPYTWNVTKFDVNGTWLWGWKNDEDLQIWWHLNEAVVGDDGSAGLAGGGLNSPQTVKISAGGELEWESEACDQKPRGLVMQGDGSLVVGGTRRVSDDNTGDFVACKQDGNKNGAVVSTWKGGTDDYDTCDIAVLGDNDSVILAGQTFGEWKGGKLGGRDFAAVNLDNNLTEIWRWQGGTEEDDSCSGGGRGDNGSVILVGSTYGEWEKPNQGGEDFAAVKLNTTDGSILWEWQGGTNGTDRLVGAALGDEGTVFLGGFTTGLWGEVYAGGIDFAGVLLNLDDGTELYRWQNGTEKDDIALDVAGGYDGLVVLAGVTEGNWSQANQGGNDSFAVLLDSKFMVSESGRTVAPTTSETPLLISLNPSPQGFASSQPSSAPSTLSLTPPTSGSSTTSSTLLAVVLIPIAIGVLLVCMVLAVVWHRRKVRGGKSAPILSLNESISKHPKKANNGKWNKGAASSRWHSVRGSLSNKPQKTSYSNVLKRRTTGSGLALRRAKWANSTAADKIVFGGSLQRGKITESTPTSMPYDEKLSEELEYDIDPENPATGDSLGAGGRSDSGQESSTRGRRSLTASVSDDVSVSGAVQDAARKLADRSPLPVVREAANLVSVMASLMETTAGNTAGVQGKQKTCLSILRMLRRAAEVLGKGSDASTDSECVLLEDVHDAVDHLVDLIKTYQSKNQLAQVMTSSLFQRRQEEAEAVIDSAVAQLQLSLHVRIGHKMGAIDHEGDKRTVLESNQENSPEEARHLRRKRQLDQIEISEDLITITDELLGEGGFGSVYIADFNGQNAAAKVIKFEHTFAEDDSTGDHAPLTEKSKVLRNGFLRELEAMMRLRSPYTVNVYGIITTRKDSLVLVMELLPGGDLRSLLRNASEDLPEEQVRLITKDVCAGIVFLHSKNTVHGDLKSPNVLFDGAGRAKIADFGTSRWMRHASSTGLVTYKTKASTHMSFAWAAPEVLDAETPSFASDVYSFGVVVWEVLSRDKPWINEVRPREIMTRVFKGERLPISERFPADLASIMQACWVDEPKKRPTAGNILKRLQSPSPESGSLVLD